MISYLVDRMVIANPRFHLARELHKEHALEYIVIEEISYESRSDNMNSKKIKQEAIDSIGKGHIEVLKAKATDMMEAGILKPNEGCGDAMLVAEYLTLRLGEQTTIFDREHDDKVIVTDDGRLRLYCTREEISVMSSDEFFNLCMSLSEGKAFSANSPTTSERTDVMTN